jgi:hypothetical protein
MLGAVLQNAVPDTVEKFYGTRVVLAYVSRTYSAEHPEAFEYTTTIFFFRRVTYENTLHVSNETASYGTVVTGTVLSQPVMLM